MTTTRLYTDDGITLEALVDTPDDVQGTLVLCHPHPQHGGTMRAPILVTIAKRAVAAGYRTLRFNFRGVGESTGTFGGGVDELADVAAAATFAAALDEPLAGIAGWSFGAATALNWQAVSRSGVPYVGIAPPVTSPLSPPLPDPSSLTPATRKFIIGARDQFVAAADLEVYASSIGATIAIYPGADHFFLFKHDQLADDVLAVIES